MEESERTFRDKVNNLLKVEMANLQEQLKRLDAMVPEMINGNPEIKYEKMVANAKFWQTKGLQDMINLL